jgi:hypothetical protein
VGFMREEVARFVPGGVVVISMGCRGLTGVG